MESDLDKIVARVEGTHCSCEGSYRGCDRCGVAYCAVEELLAIAETQRKVAMAWKQLYDERRDAADRLDAVRELLAQNGCDCDGDCDESHDGDCDRCLACRIADVVSSDASAE
jgi:hypothetical protein